MTPRGILLVFIYLNQCLKSKSTHRQRWSEGQVSEGTPPRIASNAGGGAARWTEKPSGEKKMWSFISKKGMLLAWPERGWNIAVYSTQLPTSFSYAFTTVSPGAARVRSHANKSFRISSGTSGICTPFFWHAEQSGNFHICFQFPQFLQPWSQHSRGILSPKGVLDIAGRQHRSFNTFMTDSHCCCCCFPSSSFSIFGRFGLPKWRPLMKLWWLPVGVW